MKKNLLIKLILFTFIPVKGNAVLLSPIPLYMVPQSSCNTPASLVPVTQNIPLWNNNTQIFRGIFNSMDWSGDIQALPVTLGQIATKPIWSASQNIPLNSRIIITRDWTGENKGIAFRWPTNYTSYMNQGNLPPNLANFLIHAPYPSNTTELPQIQDNQKYGQLLLNYLRGDRSQEAQNGGSFRNRNSILGDIINSSPLYVAAPFRNYTDSAYVNFKNTYANRTPMIYVGANDGMLHAFRASDGMELLAYVPGAQQIYQNIPNLSLPAYTHLSFVDGNAVQADVSFSSNWHTILVSTLGNGAQSLFALDITDPSNFNESNAANIYLWEFSDQNDPDFGTTGAKPIIAQVAKDQWAVIINNGYNNTQPDNAVSTTGQASLFILLLEGNPNVVWSLGQNYIKIPVGGSNVTNANGLSAPFAIDTNGDGIVDFVYAGDLQGNLWKFKPSTNLSQWSASLLFSAVDSNNNPQPITSSPIVGPHPTGIQNGVMVYFGTGKYLELTDNTVTSTSIQSIYGLWDQMNDTPVPLSSLLPQQILSMNTTSRGNYRTLSSYPINWSDTTKNLNRGWYLNLPAGERVISQPILRNNNAIFSTMTPSGVACQSGKSWLMMLNAHTGGAPRVPILDTNNDGLFTFADLIPLPDGALVASGWQSTVGIISYPAIFIMPPQKLSEVMIVNGYNGVTQLIENPHSGPTGRQNWRQLFQ